jgi:hypothetical protein
MIWAGVALVAVGVAWQMYFHWLRHRPHNLERGTQHLALTGSCGCVLASTVGMALIVIATKGLAR